MSFFMLIRALFSFVISAAFKEGELSINKPTFNPVKFMLVSLLVFYLIFSTMFMFRLFDIYVKVEEYCPGLTKEIMEQRRETTRQLKCPVNW